MYPPISYSEPQRALLPLQPGTIGMKLRGDQEVCRDRHTGHTFVVYYSWRLYTRRDEEPWMEQELGTFDRGVQVPPQRAGVSVTGVLLRLVGGPAFRLMVCVPFTRRPVSVRLTRGLDGRLGASETQVLNGRPVSLGLTKLLPVSVLGKAVRRLEVATSGYGSLHLTVRGHWAACS